MPCTGDSLNSGDVFILDKGLKLFVWTGKKGGSTEKFKGIQVANDIKAGRNGKVVVSVVAENDEPNDFWEGLIGGKPARIKTAQEGGDDALVDKEMGQEHNENKLFEVSDDSGVNKFTLVAEGGFKKNMLNSGNCFILDIGKKVFIWIGNGSSANEKKMVFVLANNYLKENQRPPATLIVKMEEGKEVPDFLEHFH